MARFEAAFSIAVPPGTHPASVEIGTFLDDPDGLLRRCHGADRVKDAGRLACDDFVVDDVGADADRVRARGWLEWWANESTMFESVEVSLVIDHKDGNWTATGHLTDSEDVEGFAFLCELDPVFALRFDDGSLVEVDVRRADGCREFDLTEYADLG